MTSYLPEDLSDAWVTLEAYWQGRRDSEYPLPDGYEQKAIDLLIRVDGLLTEYYDANPSAPKLKVSSGYRPRGHNKAIGGATQSRHMFASAVDLADPGNALDKWLDANPEVLARHKLWREHPAKTNSWCHLDTTDRGPNQTFWP